MASIVGGSGDSHERVNDKKGSPKTKKGRTPPFFPPEGGKGQNVFPY